MNVKDYPPIVVVRISRHRWKLAEVVLAEQVKGGPVVVTYQLVKGLAYRRDPTPDAEIVLRRLGRMDG